MRLFLLTRYVSVTVLLVALNWWSMWLPSIAILHLYDELLFHSDLVGCSRSDGCKDSDTVGQRDSVELEKMQVGLIVTPNKVTSSDIATSNDTWRSHK